MWFFIKLITYFSLCCFLSSPLQAEIFSWKDKKGKTHYGDRIPEEYSNSASKVGIENLNTVPLNETIKKEAVSKKRAAMKKRFLSENTYKKKTKQQAKPANSHLVKVSRNLNLKQRKADCKAKHDAYAASLWCFDVCRTFQGVMNASCVKQQGCVNAVQPDCTVD